MKGHYKEDEYYIVTLKKVVELRKVVRVYGRALEGEESANEIAAHHHSPDSKGGRPHHNKGWRDAAGRPLSQRVLAEVEEYPGSGVEIVDVRVDNYMEAE